MIVFYFGFHHNYSLVMEAKFASVLIMSSSFHERKSSEYDDLRNQYGANHVNNKATEQGIASHDDH